MPASSKVCAVCCAAKTALLYARALPAGTLSIGGRIELHACRRCGYVFSEPRPTPEELDRYYRHNPLASGVNYLYTPSGLTPYRRDLMRRRVEVVSAAWQRPGDPSRVLDVGCSYGAFLAALPWRSAEKWGIDPAPPAVEQLEAQGFKALCARLEDLHPDSLGAFEIITAMSVLEHLLDPRTAFMRLAELTAPHGMLVVELPETGRPIPLVCEYFDAEHLNHFTPQSFTNLAAQFKMSVTEIVRRADDPYRFWAVCRREERAEAQAAVERCEDLAPVIRRYAEESAAYRGALRKRLADVLSAWQAEGRRPVIYGAGGHTLYLLELLPPEAGIACLYDSDPAKWGGELAGFRIFGPQELRSAPPSGVIISSYAAQESIAGFLMGLPGADIEIFRCYQSSQG